MKWAAQVTATCAVVLAAHPSLAADPPAAPATPINVKMEWTEQNCVSTSEIERAVESMLQRRAFEPQSAADVTMRVVAACNPASPMTAALAMSAADGRPLGERHLQGDPNASEQFSEAIALVVALAIDSLQAESATLRLPPPRELTVWRGRIAPTAMVSFGRFPNPALGYGLGASVAPPHFWPLSVSLLEWTPTRVEHEGKGAEFTGWQASLSLRPTVFARPPFEASACLGAEVARLRARGFGLDTSREADSWVPSVLGQADFSAALGRHFGLNVLGGLGVPFVRDRFVYGTAQGTTLVLHQPSVVSGQVGIALAVTIP